MEKHREMQKEVQIAFVDLETAYDIGFHGRNYCLGVFYGSGYVCLKSMRASSKTSRPTNIQEHESSVTGKITVRGTTPRILTEPLPV